MEIIGYILSVLIGLSLGLIGGGGSILTVPLLVYIFNVDPTVATSYSLFIVGFSSVIGASRNYKNGNVDIKTALLFGASSIATVLFVRGYIIPIIPDILFSVGDFQVTKSIMTMVLFAILMLLASRSMIKGRKEVSSETKPVNVIMLILYGVGIGCVTGFLGAGGGFLLIPALVIVLGLDMKKAVGTSLMIIAMNSLIGFLGDVRVLDIDWTLLLPVTAIAIAGIFLGVQMSTKIPGGKLKKGFGYFVFIMGTLIIIKEIFIH